MDSREIVLLIIIAAIGYLLGSLNFSVIIGKTLYKTDVREHGSGNAGLTNSLRTLGKKAAIFTLLGDLVKGVLACLVGMFLLYGEYSRLGLIMGGAFAIIGHNWPIYFKFKGGKGVLTSLAVMLMVAPIPALLALAVFAVVLLLSRYVSLSSIAAVIFLPFFSFFLGNKYGPGLGYNTYFAIFLAILIIIRHRSNIVRIFKGTENKFSFSKNK
ncbi:MAG: glycerol-3-phosphate 1-O-acyltransferase PlsY [Clostridiales bacterium]|jgi:glycerol-3-phosphate acyltransferase PlsY|nr:glycerol-3-phosphate 1-O-acyltransferase PlsY [Clostridiales bacterium]